MTNPGSAAWRSAPACSRNREEVSYDVIIDPDGDGGYIDRNVRIADTPTLMRMVELAEKLELNRQLGETVVESLDSDGYHVLTLMLLDHQAHNSDLPVHHRASALLKISGDARPFCVVIDVTHDWWRTLVTMSEYRQAQDELGNDATNAKVIELAGRRHTSF